VCLIIIIAYTSISPHEGPVGWITVPRTRPGTSTTAKLVSDGPLLVIRKMERLSLLEAPSVRGLVLVGAEVLKAEVPGRRVGVFGVLR
jgi:hypothetical protein